LLEKGDKFVVMGSDGVWDVMSSAEVCGFINNYQLGNETCAEALLAECRVRWDEMNRLKKTNSKIGDLPYLKFGCDDMTCVIAYLNFED
jgi:integrin-linked kinase-associated serine/threonine phosphatase 2C